MAGIAGDEHARQTRANVLRGNVVVLVANALADLVHGPPRHLFDVKLVGEENTLRRSDDLVHRDLALGHALVFAQLVHLHIESNQIAAFARDNQQVAAVVGLDGHLVANIRKVGHGQNVHYAPGLLSRVTHQLSADGLAHHAACAVAAHHVTRPRRLHLARVRFIRAFQAHRHGVVLCITVHPHVH